MPTAARGLARPWRYYRYSALIQVIKSKTSKGFVANVATSVNKERHSQPPVGSKILFEMCADVLPLHRRAQTGLPADFGPLLGAAPRRAKDGAGAHADAGDAGAAAGAGALVRATPMSGRYKKYKEAWIVELLFDDLYDWNTWFVAQRSLSPLNITCLGAIEGDMQDARYESGKWILSCRNSSRSMNHHDGG